QPEDLRDEVRKLFLLTKREELRDLRRRKEELSKYYHMRALPDDYFELPAKKRELPDAVQDLTPRLREMLPFCPKDNEDFDAHIKELRKVYGFRYLPNDYLIRKKRLPDKPEELNIKEKFEFPIMDKETALRFIEQIPNFYRVVTPLPSNYVGINYTALEDLPVNWKDISKVNLTLPITSTKELMIA
ncbi:13760_t:CDS:1, partial [Gigaspora margarita]